MAKHTPREVVEQILENASTMTINQMVTNYGVKYQTVRLILKRNSTKAKRSGGISKESLEEALSEGPLGIKGLAEKLDVSPYMVCRALKTHGIVVGRKPHTRSRLREGCRSFKILGYIIANPTVSLNNIAIEFNCSREFIGQVAAKARQEGIIK
jgi:hypothetical protein